MQTTTRLDYRNRQALGNQRHGPAVPILITFIMLALVASSSLSAQTTSTGPSMLSLENLLWREARDRADKPIGVVSDVLAEIPSGRIVFVLIKSTELFERPKAVPPGAISVPAARNAPIRIAVATDDWLNAPRLDWDSKSIVKNGSQGQKIYAFYQQPWIDPEPSQSVGVQVVTPKKNAPPPAQYAQYVSLSNLTLHRVTASGWEQDGYLRGFLLDWPSKRATHALVSPTFVPLPTRNDNWFAVATSLLNPPDEDGLLTVNSNADAFKRAPRLAAGQNAGASAPQIFLYPAGEAMAITAAAE